METAVLRQMTISFILAVLVEQCFPKRRKLVVIDHHRKALRGMLPDEGIDNAE